MHESEPSVETPTIIAQVERIASLFRFAAENSPDDLPDFPRGQCGTACLILNIILLEELGISGEYICGRFRLNGEYQSHAWLVVASYIVDVTADQFAATFPDLNQPVIVTRQSSWHQSLTIEQRSDGLLSNPRERSEYGAKARRLKTLMGKI